MSKIAEALIIIFALLFLSVGYLLGQSERKYDCSISEHSPDTPTSIKEVCRNNPMLMTVVVKKPEGRVK